MTWDQVAGQNEADVIFHLCAQLGYISEMPQLWSHYI